MADEYPVLKDLETKLTLQWVDVEDVMATQRAIIQVEPAGAYLELPRGRRGPKGDKGDRGPGLQFQGIVKSFKDLPSTLNQSNMGWAWVNTSTKELHIWNGTSWIHVPNFAAVEADLQTISQWVDNAEVAATSAAAAANTAMIAANSAQSEADRAQTEADRAEAAMTETIAQVEGDFATVPYVDGKVWAKGYFPADKTLLTAPPATYGIPSGVEATRLGLPVTRIGTVDIRPAGGVVRTITFITNADANASQEVWGTATDTQGVLQAWVKFAPVNSFAGRNLTTSDTLLALKPASYPVIGTDVSAALGLPVKRLGSLTVRSLRADRPDMLQFTFITDDPNPLSPTGTEVWQTSTRNGAVQPWRRLFPVSDSKDYGARHLALVDEKRRRSGGPIYTGRAVPVCFTWDDYPAMMRDKGVIDLIKSLGLKINMALGSDFLTPERAPFLAGGTIEWSEIDAWVKTGLVEISNHSSHHMEANTEPELYDAIVGSQQRMEALMPSTKGQIWTWIHPNPSYPGFGVGSTPEAFTDNYAGQLIMGHHIASTGVRSTMPDGDHEAVPMLGTPYLGQKRMWVDGKTAQSWNRTEITKLYGSNKGVILGTHANAIDDYGWTYAEMESYLRWLKAEQDAGNIKLLHFSEFAIAQSGYGPKGYDTGWKNINSLLPEGMLGTSGELSVRRVGKRVTVVGANLRPQKTGNIAVASLPLGFRPSRKTTGTAMEDANIRPAVALSFSPYTLEVVGVGAVNSTLNFTVAFDTDDPEV